MNSTQSTLQAHIRPYAPSIALLEDNTTIIEDTPVIEDIEPIVSDNEDRQFNVIYDSYIRAQKRIADKAYQERIKAEMKRDSTEQKRIQRKHKKERENKVLSLTCYNGLTLEDIKSTELYKDKTPDMLTLSDYRHIRAILSNESAERAIVKRANIQIVDKPVPNVVRDFPVNRNGYIYDVSYNGESLDPMMQPCSACRKPNRYECKHQNLTAKSVFNFLVQHFAESDMTFNNKGLVKKLNEAQAKTRNDIETLGSQGSVTIQFDSKPLSVNFRIVHTK